MVNSYELDGYDLTNLFSKNSKAISFDDDLKQHVPSTGSIIYTIWDKKGVFIYVGIAGIQSDPTKRQGLTRLKAHASGRRSGDQFCIYVHDFYVLPKLVSSGDYTPKRGLLDDLTKDYIRSNLTFKVKGFDGENSDSVVRSLEDKIKRGVFDIPAPVLNGVERLQ